MHRYVQDSNVDAESSGEFLLAAGLATYVVAGLTAKPDDGLCAMPTRGRQSLS
jgi:hypothetical protein